MDRAKAAVSEFLHNDGRNDTTVHEHIAPAVVKESILKTKHEEVQTVVDKEIHQDHHHITVQPVVDREILPERHTENIVGVETREHVHGNSDAIKARLAEEAAQFRSTRTVNEGQATTSQGQALVGEHIHHHVHETIQPVVEKEIIQNSVVHTVVPIHEVHHNEAKHHATSALPPISMAEFKQSGGVLSGRDERTDHFEGEPKGISSHLGNKALNETGTGTGVTGHHHHHNNELRSGTGVTGNNSRLDDTQSGLTGSSRLGTNVDGSYRDQNTSSSGSYGNTGIGNQLDSRVDDDTTDGTGNKPGLLSRLNPLK